MLDQTGNISLGGCIPLLLFFSAGGSICSSDTFSPLAHEGPLSLWSSKAQTCGEKRARFVHHSLPCSLLDLRLMTHEITHSAGYSKIQRWDLRYPSLSPVIWNTPSATLCYMGYAATMIDSSFGSYWELEVAHLQAAWGFFDKVLTKCRRWSRTWGNDPKWADKGVGVCQSQWLSVLLSKYKIIDKWDFAANMFAFQLSSV